MNSIPQGESDEEEDVPGDRSANQMREEVKSSDNMIFIVEDGRDVADEWNMDVNEKVEKIMGQINPDNKYTKKWAAQRMAQKQAEEEVTRIMGPPGQRGRANPYKP